MAAEDVVEVVEEDAIVVVAEEMAPDRYSIAGHMEEIAAILVHNAWHLPQEVIKMQLCFKIEWAALQKIAMNDGVGLKMLIKLVK